jgi:hypothetical protein
MQHGIKRAHRATHAHDSENRGRNTRVEIHMDQPVNAFDLSPEQQETASLLQRLLGSAITNRYVDFCRLAAGAFALNVSRPMAAHALRELDSMLRGALEVPMEARTPETAEDAEKIAEARKQLRALGFEDQVIDRAARELKPRLNHKQQIRQIVSRLGLAPDGDIANLWTSLTENFGGAHQRSFHRSLQVDDDFREKYQRPFDTVIRAVAVALQGRYVALMRRVEELAAMADRKQAAKLFASEIPGALPLQRHFFDKLQTADWLPHLAKQGLFGEPLAGPDEGASGGMRFRQWPAGNYLLRMAKSPDAIARRGVAEALRKVGSSKHPDVQYDGLEILAALPPEESAPLADLAVSWLSPGARNWPMQTPEALIKQLAQGGHREAALKVARALLQIWEQNGHLVTHYAHRMYEYHLPSLVDPLAACCGEDALRLFADLLYESARITGRIDSGHYSMRPMGDDGMAQHDVYESLISAARRSAEALIQEDATRMRGVVEFLAGYEPKIFVRLYLHVLASNPVAAPDLATAYLTDPSLIEASWCRDEYSRLALAWFQSLTAADQAKVLGVIDALPDKYLNAWKARFEEHRKKPPVAGDERKFRAATFRDVVWKWRAALPAERQEALDRVVQELGDPDAWKEQLFPQEESPLRGTDFSSRPISEIADFLRTWTPQAAGSPQTVTALAQELRIAAFNNPEVYAAEAAQFAELKPVYVRQVLEGLAMAANNRRKFDWGGVLKLITAAVARHHEPIDPATLFDGDDRDWSWASAKAAELLAAGLRQGAEGIAFEHADQVRSIVETLIRIAPDDPEIEDFEERYRREPFFAAQATVRGLAVELCILLMFWLSKDPSSPLAAEPRKALSNSSNIRDFFDGQLADRTAAGRIPRAIMGRYLCFLFYFGVDWLRAHMDALFPQDDEALRGASWYGHLAHDQQPILDLVPELRFCLAEEIARSADTGEQADREFRRERFADYLMVLYLWGGLPDDLLESFWDHAPSGVRQHCMWCLGTQLALPDMPDATRARGFAYWERRLDAARRSDNPDAFRAELGAIGQWTLRDQIDDHWLADQLFEMLQAGFVPTDAFSVVDWLAKLAPRNVNRAVEILSALLRNPCVDQWAYMTQQEPIRTVLAEGLAHGTQDTIAKVHELIGFLSSINETGYIDLIRSAAAE